VNCARHHGRDFFGAPALPKPKGKGEQTLSVKKTFFYMRVTRDNDTHRHPLRHNKWPRVSTRTDGSSGCEERVYYDYSSYL